MTPLPNPFASLSPDASSYLDEDGSFTVPQQYWPITVLFLFVYFVSTAGFVYFGIELGMYLREQISESVVPEGEVFHITGNGLLSLSLIFLGIILIGIPLALLFEKLFPKVAVAQHLQYQDRGGTASLMKTLFKYYFLKVAPSPEGDQMYHGVKTGQKYDAALVKEMLKKHAVFLAVTVPLISIPILPAAWAFYSEINTYAVISEAAIAHSPAVSNEVLEFTWDDVTKIEFYGEKRENDDNGEVTLEFKPNLYIHLEDHTIPLWDGNNASIPTIEQLKYLRSLQQSKTITLLYSTELSDKYLSDENRAAVRYIRDWYSDENNN